MSSVSTSKLRTAVDVVAIVRRSLLGVRGASSGGTGWVVLGNGLVMTSHEAVGYQSEVYLELESGRRAEGRVIWVDVARDLALVLPTEQLPLPPLIPRPDLPRLGEPVLALSAVPDQPWRVVSGMVSAAQAKEHVSRYLSEIDKAPGDPGLRHFLALGALTELLVRTKLPPQTDQRLRDIVAHAQKEGAKGAAIDLMMTALQRINS